MTRKVRQRLSLLGVANSCVFQVWSCSSQEGCPLYSREPVSSASIMVNYTDWPKPARLATLFSLVGKGS